jgi:hypothetical protein
MTKAYFASAVAGTLLLGLATGANAATHRGELLAPAYAARGASVAADCSIHGQFNGKSYCFGRSSAQGNFVGNSRANLARTGVY